MRLRYLGLFAQQKEDRSSSSDVGVKYSKLPPHPNVVEVYGAILSGGEDQGIILELCSEVIIPIVAP